MATAKFYRSTGSESPSEKMSARITKYCLVIADTLRKTNRLQSDMAFAKLFSPVERVFGVDHSASRRPTASPPLAKLTPPTPPTRSSSNGDKKRADSNVACGYQLLSTVSIASIEIVVNPFKSDVGVPKGSSFFLVDAVVVPRLLEHSASAALSSVVVRTDTGSNRGPAKPALENDAAGLSTVSAIEELVDADACFEMLSEMFPTWTSSAAKCNLCTRWSGRRWRT